MSDTSENLRNDFPLAVPMPEIEWAAVRTRRDQLLLATDFTQLPDYPATAAQLAEVTAYRKALRDVPEKAEHPDKVVWPSLPAFVK